MQAELIQPERLIEPPLASRPSRAGVGTERELFDCARWSRRQAAFLAEASKRLASSIDHEVTLRTIAHVGLPELGDACVIGVATAFRTSERLVVAHRDPSRRARLAAILDRPAALSWLVALAETTGGQPTILDEASTEALLEESPEHPGLAATLGLRSTLVVPVVAHGRTLASVAYLSERLKGYGPPQVLLAEELASRFGLALHAAHAYQACRASVRDTTERLAITAHDLTAPLTYIKGTAQLLQRQDLCADPTTVGHLRDRLGRIDAVTTRMAAALAKVVQEARACAGSQPRRTRQLTDLIETTRRAIAGQQLVSEDHAIRLLDAPASLAGWWDADQLERMLDNLLSNAVKYSPPGTAVDVSLANATDGEGDWAVLRVSDQGVGIPSGDLPFVFQPFRRGSKVEVVPGIGLGLASVWQTVKQHDGRLWVDSQEGKGTTITVRLPLARG